MKIVVILKSMDPARARETHIFENYSALITHVNACRIQTANYSRPEIRTTEEALKILKANPFLTVLEEQ